MSAFDSKILWTVNMPTAAAENQLLQHAIAAGCTGVAIRTSNDRLPAAISRFHQNGLKVFAWRWPACRQPTNIPNFYAIDQANYVAQTLIPAGLDGYFADIESDGNGTNYDWADPNLAPLATQFCSIIKNAAPYGFYFALTAGCTQPEGSPKIPWAAFSPFCDAVMPQTYWRWTNSAGEVQDLNGGTPTDAYNRAEPVWSRTFPGKPIAPILGELDVISAKEIQEFGTFVSGEGVRELHAYTDGNAVSQQNLQVLAAL